MGLSQIQQLQINKQVDMILHAPGSQVLEKQQLEMAFVFDMAADEEFLNSTAKDIVASLKACGETDVTRRISRNGSLIELMEAQDELLYSPYLHSAHHSHHYEQMSSELY